MCRHSRSAVEHWLIVVMQPNAHLLGLIVSGVRVCVSFKIISRVVCRLGSEVRVSASFQSFALRMFVCPFMFCRPLCQKGHFSVPSVLSCFRETTEWRCCVFSHGRRTDGSAILKRRVQPTYNLQLCTRTVAIWQQHPPL